MGARKILPIIPEQNLHNSHLMRNNFSTQDTANYVFQTENSSELYRLGKIYLEKINKGMKNFAFTSIGYKNSQQKTILGLSCFIDQSSALKIAIISDHLSFGVFHSIVKASSLNEYVLLKASCKLKYYSFHHHFDFINFSEFFTLWDSSSDNLSYEEISIVLDNYDLIFWDVPEMEKMKNNQNFYNKISRLYDSMTVVISQEKCISKQIKLIKKFFGDHHINLNNILFDNELLTSKKQRKKILGIF